MSAASDQAISTLAGAGAVVLLAASQYIMARSTERKQHKEHRRERRQDAADLHDRMMEEENDG